MPPTTRVVTTTTTMFAPQTHTALTAAPQDRHRVTLNHLQTDKSTTFDLEHAPPCSSTHRTARTTDATNSRHTHKREHGPMARVRHGPTQPRNPDPAPRPDLQHVIEAHSCSVAARDPHRRTTREVRISGFVLLHLLFVRNIYCNCSNNCFLLSCCALFYIYVRYCFCIVRFFSYLSLLLFFHGCMFF